MTSGSIVEQISRLGPQLLEQAAPFILSRRPPLQRGPIGRETVFPREGFVGWWLELQQWAPACTTCDQTREPGGNGPNPTRRRAAAGCNVQNAGPARAASWTVLSDPGRQRTKSNAGSCGCWVLRSERSASTASELDGLARPRVATDQIQRVVVRLLGRRFRRQRQHRQRVGRSCQTRRAVTTGVCNKIPVECSRADP